MAAPSNLPSVANLYRIIPLTLFRRTPGVAFDVLRQGDIPVIAAIDRVLHDGAAVSPGPVGAVQRPWYMHPAQDDNLMVLAGIRHVEIYTPEHGRIEQFDVTPNEITHNGTMLHQGPAMLVWPRRVFHRIASGPQGSASINLAAHYDGFDIRTNFNIYAVDTTSGEFRVIRHGHLDQF